MQLEMVQAIKGVLLSDRVKIGGHEHRMFSQILEAVEAEERMLLSMIHRQRVRPLPGRDPTANPPAHASPTPAADGQSIAAETG